MNGVSDFASSHLLEAAGRCSQLLETVAVGQSVMATDAWHRIRTSKLQDGAGLTER